VLRTLGLVVVASIATWGCSGGGGDQASGTGGSGGQGATGGSRSAGSITLTDFGPAFDAAYCAPLVTCGVYTTLAACEASTQFGETTEMLTAASDVETGIVSYDATAAAACIAALPADCIAIQQDVSAGSIVVPLSEVNLFTVTPACAKVLTGHATDVCYFQWECPSSTGCSVQPYCPAGTCCSGTCASLPLPAPSPLGGPCEPGNYKSCLVPGFCSNGTCIALPGEGESCGSPQPAGTTCGRLDDSCQPSTSGGTTGVCAKRAPVGAQCGTAASAGQSTVCVAAAGCHQDGLTTNYTCVAAPTLGDACSGPTDTEYCTSPLVCTANDMCGAAPPGVDCSGATQSSAHR
jgi:hypothetical protein